MNAGFKSFDVACWAGIVAMAAVSVVHANDIPWGGAASGGFGDPGNWTGNQVPGTDDRALFDNTAAVDYTVTLDTARTILGLEVLTDKVVLDLDGNSLTLTEASSGNHGDNADTYDYVTALMVGRGYGSSPNAGELVVQGGATLTIPAFQVGGTQASTGILTVQGAGTEVYVQAGGGAVLGYRGTGYLNVLSGASLSMDTFSFPTRHAAGRAHILVDGTGSTMTIRTGSMPLAIRGETHMTVSNGGLLSASGRTVTVSQRALPASLTIDNATATTGAINVATWTSEGTLLVTNGGTLTATSDLSVSTDTDGQGRSTGYVTVTGSNANNVSRLTVRNAAFGGTLTVDRNALAYLSAEDGGELIVARELRLWNKARMAVGDGVVEATQLVAVAGSEFALTLHTGAFAAPVRVVSGHYSGDATLGDMAFSVALAPGFTADVDDVFTVLSYAGALNGTFLDLDQGDTVLASDGYEFLLDYGTGSNSAITLKVTAIPEPGALLLTLLGAGALAIRRRALRLR